MKTLPLSRPSRPCVTAQIDGLEARRLFNAAVLRHGRLTVYCTDTYSVEVSDAQKANPSQNLIYVTFFGTFAAPTTTTAFRGTSIERIRVLGDGNQISLLQTFTPNLTDVVIYAGDGGGNVVDTTEAHRFNRHERVSIVGGDGDDVVIGGSHTISIDGNAGNDTLSGGEAGATLNGGDGDDVVSATPLGLATALHQTLGYSQAGFAGNVVLSGGAGDDVLVGNYSKATGITDTLSGGGGDDSFYPFAVDELVDFGVGGDQNLSSNQFMGTAQVNQTATLSLAVNSEGGVTTSFPSVNLGNNGPKSRIYVSDAQGTLTMQGPTGSGFTLGDLFSAAGYPFGRLGIGSSQQSVQLKVNGFVSSLTGNQIAGYAINPGDAIVIGFGF